MSNDEGSTSKFDIPCSLFDILFYAISQKKMPAMDIAGLCLPLKPQKERSSAIIYNTNYFQGY
jgi:hypothetical protein